MSKEEKIDEINDSKSSTVLKTIYSILILIIVINCLLLIFSIIRKNTNNDPIKSRQRVIFQENPIQKQENKNQITNNKVPQ